MTNQYPNPEARVLSGKTALVTGGSRGIGFAVAQRLGRLGASVAICARNQNHLEAARQNLAQMGLPVLALRADVMNAAQVTSMVSRIEHELGPIEVLVNNAGIGVFGPIHERSEGEWDAILDTNLKSVFLTTRAVAPGMVQRKDGHIINISSLAGKSFFAGGAIYCASKWGLMGLTACMAEDLRPHGIRVAVVCPGSVATDFSPHAGRDISKMLQPEDVAHAVTMLVLEGANSFISEVDLRPRQRP